MSNHRYPQLPAMPHVMHYMDCPIYMWMAQRDMLFNPQLDPQEQGNYWEPQHVYDETMGELLIFTKCPMSIETSRLGQADSVVQVWHGTHLFAVENAAANGLASSFDEEKGHGTLEDTPGVYATPVEATAWGYAVAMKAFRDEDLPDDQQRWTKVIFERRADQS